MSMHRLQMAVVTSAVLALAPTLAWGSPAEIAPPCPADRRIADRQTGSAPALCVVADHAHREGAFLVIDALVKNISGRPVTGGEVGVEAYSHSGNLRAAENTILRPDRLEPGQGGTVLVITPWQDGIERLRYLITWRQAGRQYQGAVEHRIVPR
jgi:hypothetical protein